MIIEASITFWPGNWRVSDASTVAVASTISSPSGQCASPSGGQGSHTFVQTRANCSRNSPKRTRWTLGAQPEKGFGPQRNVLEDHAIHQPALYRAGDPNSHQIIAGSTSRGECACGNSGVAPGWMNQREGCHAKKRRTSAM